MTAAEDPRARRRRGIALALLANLCFSTGGLWIRALDVPPGGFEIVFWRSASMTAALAVFLFAWYGRATAARIRAVGFWGFVSACCLAATFFAFILSVTRTTVANTTLVMSLTPLLGAVAGVVFLGERVAVRTWIAIAVAGVGLATMLLDSLSGDGVAGILIALGVPVAFAANIVINRRHGVATDMVPTVLIAGLVSLPLALPLALPLEANPRDAATILAMGMFQLALGCILLTLAMRHLPAAEVGLFTLLETVLAPLWVWLAFGEQPSPMALAGGTLIVGALLANSLLARATDGRPPRP